MESYTAEAKSYAHKNSLTVKAINVNNLLLNFPFTLKLLKHKGKVQI